MRPPSSLGSIQLGERLGEGGFSVVFQGLQPDGTAIAAIKQSRVSLRIERPFLRHEARILQLLQGHKSIPRLLGYFRGPHFEYIALELLGETLKEQIHQEDGAALLPETVARVGMQMLSALEHLHKQGVVHRDIKPSNVLLCPAEPNLVRLVDFGLCSLTDLVRPRDPRAHPSIVGSLPWCSVSVQDGKWPLTASDDLESLVYTLLFLLGGDLPWYDFPRSLRDPVALAHVTTTKKSFREVDFSATDSLLGVHLGFMLEHVRSLPFDAPVEHLRLSKLLHCGHEVEPLARLVSQAVGRQTTDGSQAISRSCQNGLGVDFAGN